MILRRGWFVLCLPLVWQGIRSKIASFLFVYTCDIAKMQCTLHNGRAYLFSVQYICTVYAYSSQERSCIWSFLKITFLSNSKKIAVIYVGSDRLYRQCRLPLFHLSVRGHPETRNALWRGEGGPQKSRWRYMGGCTIFVTYNTIFSKCE